MAVKKKRSIQAVRAGKGNDVHGFTVLQGRVYPFVVVPILVGWLVLMGYLNPMMGWVVGPLLIVALLFVVPSLVTMLLGDKRQRSGGFVSLPGCFIGQIVYWGSMVLGLPLLYWQGGFDLLALGALLLPIVVIGLAVLASQMAR